MRYPTLRPFDLQPALINLLHNILDVFTPVPRSDPSKWPDWRKRQHAVPEPLKGPLGYTTIPDKQRAHRRLQRAIRRMNRINAAGRKRFGRLLIELDASSLPTHVKRNAQIAR
jgi:hypothetical protein